MRSLGVGLDPGGNSVWSPAQISSLTVWLPPDSIVGVADGGTVTTWPDRSGLSHSPTQATESKKPLYRATGGANGLPAIETDGVNDFLRVAFVWDQPIHMFVVMRPVVVGDNTWIDGATGNTMRFFNASNKWSIYGGSAIVSTVGTINTSWHLFELKYNGASSSIRIDNATAVTGSAGTASPGGITLGLFGDQASTPANARYSEIIAYSAILAAADANNVRASLQTKYAL